MTLKSRKQSVWEVCQSNDFGIAKRDMLIFFGRAVARHVDSKHILIEYSCGTPCEIFKEYPVQFLYIH
jgi:hypothetical protein